MTEVWPLQTQLALLLENEMAALALPSLSSRSWPGCPLVLIRVWNPVEDAETVIRGLGLRGRSQSRPPLRSDAGQAV